MRRPGFPRRSGPTLTLFGWMALLGALLWTPVIYAGVALLLSHILHFHR